MSTNPLPPGAGPANVAVLGLPRLPILGWNAFTGARRSALPSLLDMPDVRFTTSGRAAIGLALRAMNVGPGDRVLVPTYHCPTMVAPVVAVGAEPVFFPIDRSGAPDLGALRAFDTSGIRAIIAAHYFGIPQPMMTLRTFCDERRIALIEDCAHALFGIADGRPVGQWGDYAIASLTKFLPVMEGGCLVSRNGLRGMPRLRQQPFGSQVKSFANALELGARHHRLRGLNTLLTRTFGLVDELRPARNSDAAARARASGEGRSRDWLNDFIPESTLGCTSTVWAQWCAHHVHRERIVALRRRNYLHLAEITANIGGVWPLRSALPDGAAPYVFPLWVENPEPAYIAMRKAGVPVFRWDEVWPSRPTLSTDCGREWATHVFQIGCHQDLSSSDLSRMSEAIAQIMSQASAPAKTMMVKA